MNQYTTQEVVTELKRFGALVDLVYQGATDFEVWPKVLEKLCNEFDAPKGVMFTPQKTTQMGGFGLAHNFSAELEVWERKMQKHDLWTQRAFERGLTYTGCVMRDQDLITDEELLESVMYKEIFQPINCGRLLSGVIFSPLDNHETTVACSLHRQLHKPYQAEHVEYFKLILPHMSRALGVMFRLRDAEFRIAASLHALDQLPNGLFLLNAEGYVTFANRAAQKIIAQNDGLQLRAASALKDISLLTTQDREAQIALDVAIQSAVRPNIRETRHFSQSLSVPRPSGKAPYTLNFSTLPEQNQYGLGGNSPKAIVFVNDSAADVRIDQPLLKTAYGLTAAEARLAELLANGYTNEDAAQKLGVSINTIKTQLQQIYQKTDTNNRAMLTKFLLSLTSMEG